MNLSRTYISLPFASFLPWLNAHRISSLVQKDQYDRLAVLRPYSRSCSERGFAHVAGIPAELSGYQKNSSIYTISNHCRFVLVFRRALLFRNIQPLYRPNPRPRTSTCCRCARLRKSSWLLSTPKIKLLMILPPRIVSVLHMISS